MLYIFNSSEQLLAIYKPDTDQTHAPGTSLEYFISANHVLPYGREQVAGCQYYNAVHPEQINGENVFDFSVPADHNSAQYVTEGNLVAFRDIDNYWQFFEIKRVLDVHGAGGLIRTSHCEHMFYELLDDIITDRRPTECSAYTALDSALTGTRWKVGIVDDLGINSTNFYYESAMAAVQKVASVWGGEIKVRLDVTGGVIANRYIDLLARQGMDTGKQFTYAKDIDSIERETDATDVVTALYGRGKGVEIEETGGNGRRLTFADVVWSVANGDPADKPAGQEWVGDPGALSQWGRSGRHRFDVFDDDEETDPAILLRKTWEELQQRITPRASYKLTAIELERLTGYSHEKVRLGDTVRVIDRKFSPPLLVSARVIELKRDLIRPENTEIILGNFMPALADGAIDLQKISQKVRDRAGVWDRGNQFNVDGTLNTSWLNGTIDILANGLNSAASNWYTDENGNIIFLSADGLKAMKLTGEGFAIANQKDVNGAWIWRTFGTGAGFTADEINTGKLKAEVISIGAGTTFAEGYDPSQIGDPSEAIAEHNNQASPHNLPSYCQLTSEGIKVFDALNSLRCILGQYSAGNYGLKINNGQIFSTSIYTGAEGATTYIAMIPPNKLEGYYQGYKVFELYASLRTGKLKLFENSIEDLELTSSYVIDTTNYAAVRGINKPLLLDTNIGNVLLHPTGWVSTTKDIRPETYDNLNLGHAARKWNTIYVHYTQTGDMCFVERSCPVCGQEFKPGESLTLWVNAVHDELGTMTIPMHQSCAGKPATFEAEIPETETQYQLDEETGQVKEIKVKKIIEIDEPITTAKEGYSLDSKTGQFKKNALIEKIAKDDSCARITEAGVKYYHGNPRQEVELQDILEDVEVFPEELSTKEAATETKIAKKRKPVMKKVTITV